MISRIKPLISQYLLLIKRTILESKLFHGPLDQTVISQYFLPLKTYHPGVVLVKGDVDGSSDQRTSTSLISVLGNLFPGQLDHYRLFRQILHIAFNGSLFRWTTKNAPNKYNPDLVLILIKLYHETLKRLKSEETHCHGNICLGLTT